MTKDDWGGSTTALWAVEKESPRPPYHLSRLASSNLYHIAC